MISGVAESLKALSMSRKSSKDMLSSPSSEVEKTLQIRCWKGFACRDGGAQGRLPVVPVPVEHCPAPPGAPRCHQAMAHSAALPPQAAGPSAQRHNGDKGSNCGHG